MVTSIAGHFLQRGKGMEIRLYHSTTAEAARSITKDGFRAGEPYPWQAETCGPGVFASFEHTGSPGWFQRLWHLFRIFRARASRRSRC